MAIQEGTKIAGHEALVRMRAETLISLHQRHRGPYTVHFGGVELQLLPDVFCPAYGEGSHLLGMCLQHTPGKRVLDVGTGSGALAVLAAVCGRQVVATDISESAVECARSNTLRLNLQNQVEVRLGNLFDPVGKTEKFSLILFNPPFLSGHPETLLERAIYDEGHQTLQRFFQKLPSFLESSGKALVAFSTAGDMGFFQEIVKSAGLAMRKLNEFQSINFEFFAFEIIVNR